ncbi:DUF4212 domain-containing protein [Halorubrum sp. DTA46]|uniref:DUF4212 domain-containing protein n=1 Tax=Halorubrum sp. DTA46 TaxID=3402162 RepID=UPI003AAAF7B8
MTDNDRHDSTADAAAPTDEGVARTDGGMTDVEREKQTDYLDVEINLLKPATPFMRDHLRVIWIGFAIWVVTTFGPITATRIAPGAMTTEMPVIGFPFHYFAIAIGAPGAALLLSVWYAKKRDAIDEKYGIEQVDNAALDADDPADEGAAAADGGAAE